LKNLIIEFSDQTPIRPYLDPIVSSKWAKLSDFLLGFTQLEMIRFKSYRAMEESQHELRDIFSPFANRGALQFVDRTWLWACGSLVLG
jgi:hypothetical protein